MVFQLNLTCLPLFKAGKANMLPDAFQSTFERKKKAFQITLEGLLAFFQTSN